MTELALMQLAPLERLLQTVALEQPGGTDMDVLASKLAQELADQREFRASEASAAAAFARHETPLRAMTVTLNREIEEARLVQTHVAAAMRLTPAAAATTTTTTDSPFSDALLEFFHSGGAMPDSRLQLKADVALARQALATLLPVSTTFTADAAVQKHSVYQELVVEAPRAAPRGAAAHQQAATYGKYRKHFPHFAAILALRPLEAKTARDQAHLLALQFIVSERADVPFNLLTFIEDLQK